jgi:hypothetical protein
MEQEKTKDNNLRVVVIVLGSIIAALLVFAAGVSVGIRKARFSGKFVENYERNFMGPEGLMDGPMGKSRIFMRKFEGRDFRNAHGIVGRIISVTGNKIVIKDPDDQENTIAVDDKTIIKRGRDNIKIADLANDEKIVVMGKPGEDGAVIADLIRVFDNNFPFGLK